MQLVSSVNARTGLLLLFLFKFIWALSWLLLSVMPLEPDEAQYWLWSRFLDWGYYSKPPMIAWQIAAGTHLFGHTEFGVRFFSLILSSTLPLALYAAARQAGLSTRDALVAAALLAFSPIALFTGFFSTTDLGSLLFWTLGAGWLFAAFRGEVKPCWQFGLFVALGALFKWTTLLLWLFFLPLWVRQKFPWRGVLAALSLTLLSLLPSVIWNIDHNWATFRHVWMQSANGTSNPNPLSFLGAQIALFGPVAFGLLVVSSWQDRSGITLIRVAFWLSLLIYTAIALFQKMQANWMLFAFPFAAIGAAFAAKKYRYLFSLHILSSVLLVAIALLTSPLTRPHTEGNRELTRALKEAGYHPETQFLLSDSYQTCSLLSFYNPAKERAHFINLFHRRNNQFCYWPSLKEESKKEGLFLVMVSEKERKRAVQKYARALEPYFRSSTLVTETHLKGQKWALIFACSGFTGKLPESSSNY